MDEQKLIQTAVVQSEERLRSVLAHTAFAIYKRNLLTDQYDYVSQAFFAIAGYEPQEVEGLQLENLLAMIHPADVEQVVRRIADAIAGTEAETYCLIEYRFRHKDGTYRWLQDQFRVVRADNGEPQALIGSVGDITDRKNAEEAIRRTEKKFHDLFMRLPLPLSIINNKSDLVFLNEQFTRVFGYTREEVPTLESWRDKAYPDPIRRLHAEQTWEMAVRQFFDPGLIMQPVELTVTCKNGLLRDVLVSGGVLDDSIVLTYTDITELRRNEKLLYSTYERRQKNELMNQLVESAVITEQMAFASEKIFGDQREHPFVLCLIKIDDLTDSHKHGRDRTVGEKNKLLDNLVFLLDNQERLAWESKNGIGLLLLGQGESPGEWKNHAVLAEQALGQIAVTYPDIVARIGIAPVSKGTTQIRAAYRQALTAVEAGPQRFPQQSVFHYLELGCFQILPLIAAESGITGVSEADAYIERHLGKLIRHDQHKGSHFIKTLDMILESSDLKRAAEKMYMHYQSLMYRKRRMEKILDISLDDSASRLTVQIALQLWKLQRGAEK